VGAEIGQPHASQIRSNRSLAHAKFADLED
jgi:hypothetical protein